MLFLFLLANLFFMNAAYESCHVSSSEDSTLELVQVLFRHGDRNPLSSSIYATYPYKGYTYWREGYGELTNKGKMDAYELGQFLRQRYDCFLSEYYLEDWIYVRSADVSRCLMSAQALLAALYPPPEEEMWNSDLPWQPVAVHTTLKDIDYLMYDYYPCPEDNATKIARDLSPENLFYEKEYFKLYEYLSLFTGEMQIDPDDVHALYELFMIQETHLDLTECPLPEWAVVDNVYPDKMQFLYDHCMIFRMGTKELTKIKAGPLLNDMVTHISIAAGYETTNDTQTEKLFLYSAHDTNVAAMLMLLDVYYPLQPPDSSAVIFELHTDDTHGHVVKLFYRNDTTVDPYALKLPDCSAIACPLDEFLNITSSLVVTDVIQECHLQQTTTTAPHTSYGEYLRPPSYILISFVIYLLLSLYE